MTSRYPEQPRQETQPPPFKTGQTTPDSTPDEQRAQSARDSARDKAAERARAQEAATAAKERSAAAKAKADDEAKARIAAAERARERARAQEAAIAAKERSAAAKAKADDEARARVAVTQQGRGQAAEQFEAAFENVDSSPQERQMASEISTKLRAGIDLNDREIRFVAGAVEISETKEIAAEAESRGIPPQVAMAVLAPTALGVAPTGGGRTLAVIKLLSAVGVGAATIKAIEDSGWTPPQNATSEPKPIDKPQTQGAVDFGAPQGAEVKTTGIDKQDVKIGTEGIDARPVAGTSASVGLAGELKDIETLDPAEAVREANRIIQEAQKAKAVIAARLKDARERAASPSATPNLREKYAEEARAEREQLEQLDDIETQAKAIRERAVAADAQSKVASQGTASETGPKPGAVVSPSPASSGTETATSTSPAETAKAATESEPRVKTGPENPAIPQTEAKPVDADQTVSRAKDLNVSATESGSTTATDKGDKPADVDDNLADTTASTTSTAVATGATTGTTGRGAPIPPVPFDDDEPGGAIAGEGEYPREVQWRQGKAYRQFDLATAAITSSSKPKPGGVRPGITPQETLKVIKKSKTPPRIRQFSMGRFIATVGPASISFSRAASRMAAPATSPVGTGNEKPVTGFEDSKKKTGFTDARKSPGFKP